MARVLFSSSLRALSVSEDRLECARFVHLLSLPSPACVQDVTCCTQPAPPESAASPAANPALGPISAQLLGVAS